MSLLALAGTTYFWTRKQQVESLPAPLIETIPVPTITAIPERTPQALPIGVNPLQSSVVAAGEYLVRQQLANGELSYQVHILNHERAYAPLHLRLVAGTGALFSVCRVSGDDTFCDAGDRALAHYLGLLVSDPQRFKGTCLYTNGSCPLGGAALVVDAVYKRWQVTGSFALGEYDLLAASKDLGYFIVSMRRPGGGFYHAFDPHVGGMADPDYFSASFPGAGVSALLQLYEMSGNDFWLQQAREVHAYMITQPVTEDHWHSYAFSLLARLDVLSQADQSYAREIADAIIAGQVRSLNPVNSSISTATKVEALSALAQALYLSGAEHAWLEREIRPFIVFVQARQLPRNNCNFDPGDERLERYTGGVFNSCEDPTIRVDGVQHWINGLTMFLEYRALSGTK